MNDITVERRFNLQNLHLTEADRVPLNYAEIKTFPDLEWLIFTLMEVSLPKGFEIILYFSELLGRVKGGGDACVFSKKISTVYPFPCLIFSWLQYNDKTLGKNN